MQTLNIRQEGPVIFAEISAPPMNLLGPELVRDLVALIQRAEGDTDVADHQEGFSESGAGELEPCERNDNVVHRRRKRRAANDARSFASQPAHQH